MKTFRYELGHEWGRTMTVSELRERLNEFPQDMPVLATWETVVTPFVSEGFKVRSFGDHPDDVCDCLIINVDQY